MAIMVVAMAGMVLLVGIASVAAGQHEPSATRNFNPATVAPGGRVTVTIQVANYGGFGRVTETLPAGFAYVSSTHDSAGLNVNGQEVRFTLQGDSSVAYTVTASRTAGSHSFSGMLRDSDRTDHPVGGPSSVQVGRPSPPPPPPPAPSPTQNRAPAFPGSSATRSVDGNSASGATNAAYMVTAGDTGYYLRVMATYTDAVGTDMDMEYSMPTMMVVAEAEDTLLSRYDANDNDEIDLDEVFKAIDDYFDYDDRLTLEEVYEIVDLYFES